MKHKTYKLGLIEYIEPTVTLLSLAPIGLVELGARNCYSSHSGSNNEVIREIGEGIISPTISDDLHDANVSETVENIIHSYHHDSIIEHVTMSFLVQNINRAVMQELARHRIAVSLSVQSTRYTVSDIIKLFFVSLYMESSANKYFVSELQKLNVLNIVNDRIVAIKLESIFNQLLALYLEDEKQLKKEVLSKEALATVEDMNKYANVEEYSSAMRKAKNKRNAGDTVKAVIVDEMFNVDVVLTMNLRSLKAFLKLRDSGAAWKPIQELAKQIKAQMPEDYMRYIERRRGNE